MKHDVPAVTEPLNVFLANPGSTRKGTVAAQIKDLILAKGLESFDPLPAEAELCTELGVSRSSIREAIRSLEALDIVSVHQGKGTFVGSLSMAPLVETLAFRTRVSLKNDFETLHQLIKLRSNLDLGIAEELCAQLKGAPQPGLNTLVDMMVEKAENNEQFPAEDFAFHDGLLALYGNEVMRQMVTAVWSAHMSVMQSVPPAPTSRLLETARAHGYMLQAIQDGDAPAYRQAVRAHYAPIEDFLRESKTKI